MAFTKDGSPGDTKFAMIDRSIAHLVRSIGKNAHTDAEFHAHIAKPKQQKSLMRFRLMVSLVGAVKLAIKGVPAFQPNLAYANRVWDYLDKQVLVGEYNLPNRQPRKCLKREEARRECLACCTCTHEHVAEEIHACALTFAFACSRIYGPWLSSRRSATSLSLSRLQWSGRRAAWARTGSRSPSAGRCCTT